MQRANQQQIPDQQTSPYLRAASIDSLFEAPGPLLAGIIFVAMVAAMTALKTGQNLTWGCVALLILAGAARAFDLQRYGARKSTLSEDEAARWKKRYQIMAMVQAAAIGFWCSATLLSTDDAVVHMICLSVTTGVVSGGANRAYGRQWIFRLQALLSFGPAVIALAVRGEPYYVATSFVSAVYLAVLIQLSANLHRIFMQAVVAREREAALAGQFDTALNNMPHGLCMFTADGRLAVMNHRFSSMLHLSDEIVHSAAG